MIRSIILLYAMGLSFMIYAKQLKISSFISTKKEYKTINLPASFLKFKMKKGDYMLSFPTDDISQITWAKKFNMVDLGDIDNPNTTKDLMKKRGIMSIKHRLGYKWMPAFYYYTSGQNNDFVKWLIENKEKTTLNPNGPFIHCKKNGYNWCKDYYYDISNKEVIQKYIDFIETNMKNKGFNGVFFDWAPGLFIYQKEYKAMFERYKKLHPKKNYTKAVANLYNRLREKRINFVTNQAFRKEKYLLKYTTYDMTESYITSSIGKNIKIQIENKGWVEKIKITNYYPVNSTSNSIRDSLHYIDLLTKYKNRYKKYGFKNFIYLNYLAPQYKRAYGYLPIYEMKKPKNGIYFSFAMGKLTNNLVYAEIPEYRNLERDNIYFYDLGKPLGKNYSKLKAINAYVRFYTNGFVLASEAYKKDQTIKISSNYIPKKAKYLYDIYNNIWLPIKKRTVTLKLSYEKDDITDNFLPLGRVYLYK